METKFGVQTLHGKCYLRIKPRCSGNLWSSETNETALVKFIGFSGTSQSQWAQASATVLSQDQVNLSLEGATWSFLKSAFANLICAVLRKGESSLERSGSQECHIAALTYKVCCAVNHGGRERRKGGGK